MTLPPDTPVFVVLVWAVAANSALSHFTGTCTGGSAAHLGGVWLSVVFLLAALAIWARRKLARAGIVMAAAALPLLVFHALFGGQLALGVLRGQSACSILQGLPFPPDGAEAVFAALWAGQAGLIVILAVALLADWRRLAAAVAPKTPLPPARDIR